MAIAQGRLSTEVVLGNYLPPEGPRQRGVIDFEMGPIAQTDASEGLLYQPWHMIWNVVTGIFTATPSLTGAPVDVLTVADTVIYVSFTFDQAGRINIAYSTEDSSFLYWYDTAAATFVTTDLGPEVLCPNIYLDDKRSTQSASSDMLLLYTTTSASNLHDSYALWMRRQRDRFDFDVSPDYGTLMHNSLLHYYISAIGMTDELRIQIALLTTDPELPTLPDAVPIDPSDPSDPEPPTDPSDPPIPVLGYMDLARNAYRTGHIDFGTYTQLPFSAVFGQDVNGGDFNKIVYPTGLAMTLKPTVDKMQLRIEHSTDCTEAYMFLCTPAGNVLSKMRYQNVALADGVFVNLNTSKNRDALLVIATDTGAVKIEKIGIPPPVVVPPPIVGGTPWATHFGVSYANQLRFDKFATIPSGGIALTFTTPNTTDPFICGFAVVGNTTTKGPFTGSISQTVGDFTSEPAHTWGLGGGIRGYLNMPGQVLKNDEMHFMPNTTYVFNVRVDNPGSPNYIRIQTNRGQPR